MVLLLGNPFLLQSVGDNWCKGQLLSLIMFCIFEVFEELKTQKYLRFEIVMGVKDVSNGSIHNQPCINRVKLFCALGMTLMNVYLLYYKIGQKANNAQHVRRGEHPTRQIGNKGNRRKDIKGRVGGDRQRQWKGSKSRGINRKDSRGHRIRRVRAVSSKDRTRDK